MLSRVRLGDDDGFTLIELLVVMLVLGVLAAIALTSFLSQEDKARDADAKGSAATLLRHVEACFAETEDYTECETRDARMASVGMPVGGGLGQVRMTARGPRGFSIDAHSRSGTVFSIDRVGNGPVSRSCSRAAGGCRGGSW